MRGRPIIVIYLSSNRFEDYRPYSSMTRLCRIKWNILLLFRLCLTATSLQTNVLSHLNMMKTVDDERRRHYRSAASAGRRSSPWLLKVNRNHPPAKAPRAVGRSPLTHDSSFRGCSPVILGISLSLSWLLPSLISDAVCSDWAAFGLIDTVIGFATMTSVLRLHPHVDRDLSSCSCVGRVDDTFWVHLNNCKQYEYIAHVSVTNDNKLNSVTPARRWGSQTDAFAVMAVIGFRRLRCRAARQRLSTS